MAGTIATCLRRYAEENGESGHYGDNTPPLEEMGLEDGDFEDSYFPASHFSWVTNYNLETDKMDFQIKIKQPMYVRPPYWILHSDGTWEEGI
ncbi:MAG: hypothetical protein JW860_08865 [Sedimentisphaerales bacterium]|nr:hypothetical protein [Sedimentisphaerales bacterium]